MLACCVGVTSLATGAELCTPYKLGEQAPSLHPRPHPTPFRIGATNPRLRPVLRPSTRPAASQAPRPHEQAHLPTTTTTPARLDSRRGSRARHRPIPSPQRPQPLETFPQSAPLNPPTPPGTRSLHQRQHHRLEKDQRDATKRNDTRQRNLNDLRRRPSRARNPSAHDALLRQLPLHRRAPHQLGRHPQRGPLPRPQYAFDPSPSPHSLSAAPPHGTTTKPTAALTIGPPNPLQSTSPPPPTTRRSAPAPTPASRPRSYTSSPASGQSCAVRLAKPPSLPHPPPSPLPFPSLIHLGLWADAASTRAQCP